LARLPRALAAKCEAPRDGSFLARDFVLDLEAVRALLELQSDHVISIGE